MTQASSSSAPGTQDFLQRRLVSSSPLDGRAFTPAEYAFHEVRRRRANPPPLRRSRRRSADDALNDRAPVSNVNDDDEVVPAAASFYIPSLPGQPADSTLIQFAGHLPFYPKGASKATATTGTATKGSGDAAAATAGKEAHAFWYLVKARHVAEKQVLIIWFNGGPGCSSFDGALMEIGPLRMDLTSKPPPATDPPPKLRESPPGTAWNEYANVLFIDQPVGTGYSFGTGDEYAHELADAAEDVKVFLERWFEIFPEYSRMEIYLAGESYAGQYIPYTADAILAASSLSHLHLSGLLIGNGWIDPATQYLGYHEFAFQANLLTKDSAKGKELMRKVESCNATLEEGKKKGEEPGIHVGACEGILGFITDSTVQEVNSQKMCLNMYDVRLVDTFPACGMTWPPDLAFMTPYLSRPDVKTAFHAQKKDGGWHECDGRVGGNMWARTSRPSVTLLPGLLEKMKVLLFSGDQDLICCHVGTEMLIDNLHWNGKRGWSDDSLSEDWAVNNEPAGTWRAERNLTYVKLANASHMAPYDVPFAAHDMLLRFLGMDFLAAAGPASTVPSRVGDEKESILGAVHPDGTAINSTAATAGGSLSTIPKVDDTVVETRPTTDSPFSESFYNAGSAGVILILVAAAVGVFLCYRRRLRRAGKGDFASALSSAAGGLRPRGSSVGRGKHQALPDDGPHELDELVVDGDYDHVARGEEYDGPPSKAKRWAKGKSRGRVVEDQEAETMFALGDEDDEDATGDVGRDLAAEEKARAAAAA